MYDHGNKYVIIYNTTWHLVCGTTPGWYCCILLCAVSTMGDLYHPPVVLDCGTGYTKLGFAGNSQVKGIEHRSTRCSSIITAAKLCHPDGSRLSLAARHHPAKLHNMCRIHQRGDALLRGGGGGAWCQSPRRGLTAQGWAGTLQCSWGVIYVGFSGRVCLTAVV